MKHIGHDVNIGTEGGVILAITGFGPTHLGG
ncbi:hypothetical protein AVEN_45556-1, partial [Araneus ventricosus]